MKSHIKVWERNGWVFLNLVCRTGSVEVKNFRKNTYHNLGAEVSYHVKRLVTITGYKVTNETDLCL